VPGVTLVEGLGREIAADTVQVTLTPEAVARLRQIWQETPQLLTDLDVHHIDFGD
jgi:hypothetical protein